MDIFLKNFLGNRTKDTSLFPYACIERKKKKKPTWINHFQSNDQRKLETDPNI